MGECIEDKVIGLFQRTLSQHATPKLVFLCQQNAMDRIDFQRQVLVSQMFLFGCWF